MSANLFFRRCLSTAAHWTVPAGIRDAIREGRGRHSEARQLRAMPWLKENRAYRDIHRGKRGFILCSGPSIGKEDLAPLRDEICISATTFYHYEGFKAACPRYHCIPTLDRPYLEERVLEFFQQVDRAIGGATLFLGAAESELIRRQRLFPSRTVRYLFLGGRRFPDNPRALDLAAALPAVQSVSIMCLLVALYMGFKEIYLLGVDHDSLKTGRYQYCYDRRKMIELNVRPNVTPEGGLVKDRLTTLRSHVTLWEQYRQVDALAQSAGARIVNLSQGSYLDVFPSGRLSEII